MKQVLFSTNASDRKAPFQVNTSIVCENGFNKVRKQPLCEAAAPHVEKMLHSYEKLENIYSKIDIVPVACKKEGTAVVFDFVKGPTFEEHLLSFVKSGDDERLKKEIQALFCKLEASQPRQVFQSTAAFEAVFGKAKQAVDAQAHPFSNIDVNFDNFIVDENQNLTLIDYEWCFSFPVPIRYGFYRALFSFQSRHRLEEKNLFSIFEFTEEEMQCYVEMETGFYRNIFGSEHFDAIAPHAGMLKKKSGLEELFSLSSQIEDRLGAEISDRNTCIEGLNAHIEALDKHIQKLTERIGVLEEENVDLKIWQEFQEKVIRDLKQKKRR